MNLSSTSSAAEKAPRAMLWGCELNQEKRTWTVKAQKEGKQDCKLLLSTICLGEKAKEEVNLVEILPPASQEDKKTKPITIASLQASVLPMVALMGLELSPPVTFQLRAGSGPVFLSGQECYNTADLSWDEEEEELEEEEGDSDEVDDQDEDEDDVDVSLEEETPVKQVKRLASQKQASIAKKKKVEKEEEAVRPSLKDKSPVKKAKPTLKPKKPGSKK
ncbi:nucleoplasmin-2 isoform X1 [Ursus americanus]|uniref:Nucleoplasmin-2 n=1 Tax=Ursus maritimus TaxID=29073 RepID=A0A8M1FJL5_URSMA|nr:nucleoplasmin-2 isoform X1 [Ursus arctos]XP_040482490.1 nucleoplasmin-2 [Ursus maritimus]XP_045630080.1 nucleoplasmin-2 isoform X1 [Ursus americanus]